VNWPQDVDLKKFYKLKIKDLKRLHELAKKDHLDFSPEFISRLKIIRNNTRKSHALRSVVAKYLGAKLAKKLNVLSIRVPWYNMKVDDIINWPPGIEFKPVRQLNLNVLERLHELAKKDLLDFSPEFISRFKKLTGERDELRSDINIYLRDKLAKKLNVPSITVPWSHMTVSDIINWPQDVEFKPLIKMSINELKSLHKLAKGARIDFSPEFIGRLSTRLKRTNGTLLSLNQLRTSVTNHLTKKAARKLNVDTVKRLPWSRMTKLDIINWPEGVDFKPIYDMNTNEAQILYKLVKVDKLDFSPEFISRFEGMTGVREKLRSVITKYMADKLGKKLNVSIMQVPWSQMKAEDIINWPGSVDFKPIYDMNINDLKLLQELAYKDQFDFSLEFIRKMKSQKVQKDNPVVDKLEFMSANKEAFVEVVDSFGDSARKSRKRPINDIEQSHNLPLQDGINIYLISRAY
jgi:hypothetical protein